MIKTIRVEMLGGLSIWKDNMPVLENSATADLSWQAFCLLVLHSQKSMPAQDVLDALWAGHSGEPPQAPQLVAQINQAFGCEEHPENGPVLLSEEVCFCNPQMEFTLDTDQFQQCICQKCSQEEERLQALFTAAQMYREGLLPAMSNQAWLAPYTQTEKTLYAQAALELMQRLYEQKRYNELLEVAADARHTDYLEEQFHLYMFRALQQLKMYKRIVPAYAKLSRTFAQELGRLPCNEIVGIYQEASRAMDLIDQDILILKEDLGEVMMTDSADAGPLHCSYEVFKYLFQSVARSAERSGNSVAILLVSLTENLSHNADAKILSLAMKTMKDNVLDQVLRKSDTVARYSKNQYIIMLSMDTPVNAQRVIERIKERADSLLDPYDMTSLFSIVNLD